MMSAASYLAAVRLAEEMIADTLNASRFREAPTRAEVVEALSGPLLTEAIGIFSLEWEPEGRVIVLKSPGGDTMRFDLSRKIWRMGATRGSGVASALAALLGVSEDAARQRICEAIGASLLRVGADVREDARAEALQASAGNAPAPRKGPKK